MHLGANRYGKGEVRLVKVVRDAGPPRAARPDRPRGAGGRVRGRAHGRRQHRPAGHGHDAQHGLRAGEGATSGRSRRSRARLADHFVEAGPSVTRARGCGSRSTRGTGSASHEHAFQRGTGGTRVCTASRARASTAGIEDLLVLKTTGSGWEGYLREQYTSLPGDRRPDPVHGRDRVVGLRGGRRLRRRLGGGAGRDPAHVRRPLQPVGAVHAAAARRGGARGGAGDRAGPLLAAQPPPPAVRPVAVRAWRTTTRSSTPRPSRTG